MPGLPPRSDDSNRSATNPGLCIPNLTGHFMRMLGSQPLPPQTCPKQVRAQVSSHALPGRSHCFLLGLHATDLRSLGTRHAARTPLQNDTIVLQQAFLRFNAHSTGAIEAV